MADWLQVVKSWKVNFSQPLSRTKMRLTSKWLVLLKKKMFYLYSTFFSRGGYPLTVWTEFKAVDLLAVTLVCENATLSPEKY